jgi:hypothetical protein
MCNTTARHSRAERAHGVGTTRRRDHATKKRRKRIFVSFVSNVVDADQRDSG